MDKSKRKELLIFIAVLGILALITSAYLLQNHYYPELGSFCDYDESISCSYVNSSSFSEIFNVPAALLGIFWSFFLSFLAIKAIRKRTYLVPLFIWSLFGVLSSLFFILAEFILKAICPLCTVVHIISFIVIIISAKLLNSQKSKIRLLDLKQLKSIFTIIIIINLLPFLFFNTVQAEQNYNDFAQCLTDSGLVIYSSSQCGACAYQEDLFGDSYELLNVVECHPASEDYNPELCNEREISATPTWILEVEGEEFEREIGYQNFEQLSSWASCEIN
ncbi:MAG: vitamin K epoxide reductase family protein, partial [Nanoarchaeota archaeon]|nr:vitamin K epoxide reductase family protein [Nanoarchaeota archaeon]